MLNVNEWNTKIYRDEDGMFTGPGLKAQEFWDKFKIKSAPLFKDACWYHIPESWADDVRVFIGQVQSELGDRIEFQQIKEKFCTLTVYYDAKDDAAKKRLEELQQVCVSSLIKQGVYPPTQER